MSDQKNILICPLNWGLGHASRNVPIIRLFIFHNFNVIIASQGDAYKYLQAEFPELKFVVLPGYSVKYSKTNSQGLKMLLLIPKIVLWTIMEHQKIKEIINKLNVDIVFSDNRFGLWNKKTYNIFMTHQLKVKFPRSVSFLEPIYQVISNFFIRKFNECWIPDYKGECNLSGELSHIKTYLKNSYFIGPLSKFAALKLDKEDSKIKILFILSGPEPQRSIFESIIYEQTKSSNLKYVIVRGTSNKCTHPFKYAVYDILNSEELIRLINKSELIVCRSGYSSVMDLFYIKKKAVLVPTPGQTEQEYLTEYLNTKGYFYTVSQNEFNINNAINKAIEFPNIDIEEEQILEKRIMNLK
ncbi:glycosyltransferase [Bacteroidota bacterium]